MGSGDVCCVSNEIGRMVSNSMLGGVTGCSVGKGAGACGASGIAKLWVSWIGAGSAVAFGGGVFISGCGVAGAGMNLSTIQAE